LTVKRPKGRTPSAIDSPSSIISLGSAYKRVITGPVKNFSRKANKIWTFGYISYHIGIITVLAGYGISLLVLAIRLMKGGPVPDVAAGLAASYNYTLPNLLAIIFGNAEPLQSVYLFGSYAGIFTSLTWVAVIAAVMGNFTLLMNHLTGRAGSIKSGMCKATEHIRTKGFHNSSNLLITFLVFSIVWSEVFARLHLVEGMVFVHTLLGLTLLAVFPFTVLSHIMYVWVGIYYAAKTLRKWGLNDPITKNKRAAQPTSVKPVINSDINQSSIPA